MRKDFYYKSKDEKTNIHAIVWEPETQPKLIIQIVHGMCDYAARYEEVALYFNRAGAIVCAEDHLGHGNSVVDSKHYGYFADKNSTDILIEDTHELTKIMREKYPRTPYFVIGHSMGSFILRNYLTKYGKELRGAIIMGTGNISSFKCLYAKFVTRIIKTFKGGWMYRSRFMYNKTIGNNAKYFEEKNPCCWLTRDYKIIEKYERDPLCRFRFTLNANYTLFDLIQKSNKKKLIKQIPKNLPILFTSGKDDPVGNFGKGVEKASKKYIANGLTNIKIKLYNNMRHELFNELEKELVYGDIIQYINNIIK